MGEWRGRRYNRRPLQHSHWRRINMKRLTIVCLLTTVFAVACLAAITQSQQSSAADPRVEESSETVAPPEMLEPHVQLSPAVDLLSIREQINITSGAEHLGADLEQVVNLEEPTDCPPSPFDPVAEALRTTCEEKKIVRCSSQESCPSGSCPFFAEKLESLAKGCDSRCTDAASEPEEACCGCGTSCPCAKLCSMCCPVKQGEKISKLVGAVCDAWHRVAHSDHEETLPCPVATGPKPWEDTGCQLGPSLRPRPPAFAPAPPTYTPPTPEYVVPGSVASNCGPGPYRGAQPPTTFEPFPGAFASDNSASPHLVPPPPVRPSKKIELREAAFALDEVAHHLEQLELYDQADHVRDTACRLRADARSHQPPQHPTAHVPAVSPY